MLRNLLLFLLSVTAAALLPFGRSSFPAPPTAEIQAAPAPVPPPRPITKEDFVSVIRKADAGARDHPDQPFNPLASLLTDWTDAEIRHALDEALVDGTCLLNSQETDKIVVGLIREWMQRDRPAFLEWSEGIRSEASCAKLAAWVCSCWPPGEAIEGLTYAGKHPEIFAQYGGYPATFLFQNAVKAAAGQGPQAVEKCLAIMRENRFDLASGTFTWPPGFDFATLAAGSEAAALWKTGDASVFLDEWLQRDPDTAFAAILARNHELAASPGSYLFPARTSPEILDWIAAQIPELTPAERRAVVEKGAGQLLKSDWDDLARFAAALPAPEQRQVHEYAVSALRSTGLAPAIDHLAALGGPAERVAYLETMQPLPPLQAGINYLSPGDALVLRATLAEWHATPAVIEKIIARIFPALP